jgi:hypothetical protein
MKHQEGSAVTALQKDFRLATMVLLDAFLNAFKAMGLCSPLVHKSIAHALDGANEYLHVIDWACRGKIDNRRRLALTPDPTFPVTASLLHPPGVPRFTGRDKCHSPHPIRPARGYLSSSSLSLKSCYTLFHTPHTLTNLHIRHTTSIMASPRGLPSHSHVHDNADKLQSKSAQSSPICSRSSTPSCLPA